MVGVLEPKELEKTYKLAECCFTIAEHLVTHIKSKAENVKTSYDEETGWLKTEGAVSMALRTKRFVGGATVDGSYLPKLG